MKKINLLILIFFVSIYSYGQEKKTFDSSTDNIKEFLLSNIDGHITVQSHNSTKIEITYTVKEDDGSHKVYFDQREDKLIVQVENDTYYRPNEWDFNKKFPGSIRLSRNHDRSQPPNVDFMIKMPKNMIAKVSTINNGHINVNGIEKEVWAFNINGDIKINNVNEVPEAVTINGDVDLVFNQNPNKNGHYHTINGDINVLLKPNLDSNFKFKSFNGDFYTDIKNLEILPGKITRTKEGNKLQIKTGKESEMKIGRGGVELSFETFNGNAIIKTK